MQRMVSRRMPTLLEVLEQHTVSPIDLGAFLRFTALHNESDALEFYLDVIEHERHCAIYLAQNHGEDTKERMGAWRTHPSGHQKETVFDDGVAPMESETPIAMFDLVMNAQRIDQLYLQPGSAQEILLPDTLKKSIDWMEGAHAMSGDLHELMTQFRLPRDYVFQRLDRDFYPTFLQQQIFSNISPYMSYMYFSLGLLFLWITLATAFSMVFLNLDRRTRVWVSVGLTKILLPSTLSMYFIFAYLYNIDLILALLRRTQLGVGGLATVEDRLIHQQHLHRVATTIILAAFSCTAVTVLFVFVPGHRL